MPLLVVLSAAKDLAFGRKTARSFAALRTTISFFSLHHRVNCFSHLFLTAFSSLRPSGVMITWHGCERNRQILKGAPSTAFLLRQKSMRPASGASLMLFYQGRLGAF